MENIGVIKEVFDMKCDSANLDLELANIYFREYYQKNKSIEENYRDFEEILNCF